MKTLNTIISVGLGVLLATGVLAGEPESTMFYLNSSNNSYKTNFTMASHLMVLTFCVNSADSINLIFDTGVGRTIITEIANPYVVSLNDARRVKLRGLGTNEPIDGIISPKNSLSMGKLQGENQELLVVPNNVINLSTQTGHPVNGIIGHSLFEKFVVEISYSTQTIQFYDPQKYNRKIRKNEDVIPIELIGGRPFINALVTISGIEIPVKLLFDTGMSFALWLDPTTNANIQPSAIRRQDVIGQGLNGNLTGDISRVEKFRIGKFEFSNVIAAFPDTNSIEGTTESNGRNGSVGADIFRRFNVVIDYGNKQIILRKNSTYNEPFHYDMSGVEIVPIVDGMPFYRIASVGKNTPASECGLQENDELKSINGISTSTMKIAEISRLLKSKEGQTIRMIVKRNGESVKVKFKLRQLI